MLVTPRRQPKSIENIEKARKGRSQVRNRKDSGDASTCVICELLKGFCVGVHRWEVVGSKCGIQYGPFPLPLNGLPARCWRESYQLEKAAREENA